MPASDKKATNPDKPELKIDMAAKRRKKHKNQISGPVNSMWMSLSPVIFMI